MPKKILIVGDSTLDRAALSAILKKDYAVVEADNGKEAFSVLFKNPSSFSALVAGAAIPVLDGFALTRQIRRNSFTAQIPIILIVNELTDAALTKGMNCGANGVIAAPVHKAALLAALQNYIALREADADDYTEKIDKLTGIYNRETFMREAEKLIARHDAGYYIIGCFDIDHFKVINDQYGVKTGNMVLKHVASVLSEGLHPIGGTCCRVTEDKFAVLYPARYQHSATLKKIHGKVSAFEGIQSPLTFCIGRCVVNDISVSPSIMYDRAVIAGETVKGNYEQRIAYYDDCIREKLLKEQEIVSDMERALNAGEFEPWFQPQYNHATGALIGSEALVRWRKDGKIVPPIAFIGIFEKNGFIYQVDKHVWRLVCANLRREMDAGRAPLPVSVNISRHDLLQPDFIDTICNLIREFDLPIELMRLEITESAFADSPQKIIDVVTKLIECGFIVEIDDFGSGYSSLNTLKDVPAQVLKLDMKFLEARNSLRGGNIIESVVRMAKWLGMSVIAEGVETLAQANYLASIGCNYIQGYLYAKPMPLDQYEKHCAGFSKEERLLALETVENLNQNSFWDPASMDTLIFNSYVGGACIFEYHNGNAELIRLNQKFAETLCPGASVGEVFERGIVGKMDEENRAIILKSIENAIQTNDESVCETWEEGIRNASERIYVRATIRVIARSGDHYLLYGTIINTTAQRIAEQKRSEIAERIRLVMENVDGGICAVALSEDGKPRFLFGNDKHYSLMGYTAAQAREELHSFMSVIHPDDRDKAVDVMMRIKTAETPLALDFRCLKRGGGVAHVHCSISFAHMTAYGKVVIFVLTDITETILSKQSAQQLAKQLEVIINNEPGAVTAIAVENGVPRLLFANDRHYEQFGVTKEEYKAHYEGHTDFYVEEDRERMAAALRYTGKIGEKTTIEFRIKRADGAIRWMRSKINIVSYPDIDVPVQLAVTSDITEQREAALKEKLLLTEMQNMMADMPGGFVRLRADDGGIFRATYCNEGFCKLIGMDADELMQRYGADPIENVHPDDKEDLLDAIRAINREGSAQSMRYRLHRANGTYIWVTAFGRFTQDQNGRVFLNLYYNDETAREKEERQRRVILDNLPWGAGVYLFKDGQMSLIYQNKSYWELVGLYHEDFRDPAPMSAIHPDDVQTLMEKLAVAIEHHEDVICDIRLRHLKLGFRPVRLVARLVPEETGGILIVATFLPNEQVEMSYRRTLPLLLETIMEASNDYTFAKDKDLRYICCSPAFVRLAGLQSDIEAIGKTDFELFPADMAEQFRKNDLMLLQSGKPMVDFDETILLPDGAPRYCLASKRILRDAAGTAIGVYGVSHDVTKERSAMEQLKLVNDSLPGGLVTYYLKDDKLRILSCNDGFCELFGGTREGFEAREEIDPMAWVFEEDRAQLMDSIHALVDSKTPMDIHFRVHVLGGGYKWINEKAITTERRGNTAQFNAILFDVTEKQIANEQLRMIEEENSLAIRLGGSMVCRYDVAERSLTLSPEVARAYGLPEKITGVPDEPIRLGLIAPESEKEYIAFYDGINRGVTNGEVLYRQRYLGDWRWLECKSATIFSDDGKPVKAVISMFDATDRLEQEAIFKKWQHAMGERATDSYTLFRCNLSKNASYEAKEGTLITFDVDGAGVSFNDRTIAYAGQCVYPDDREKYISFLDSDILLAEYARGKRSGTLEYRELLPGGITYRWLRLSVDLVEHANRADTEAYLMYENIDEAKQKELEAKERAELDPLTGILNRASFEEKVNAAIHTSKPHTTHALLMLDVDGFKLINDVFGHGAGDEALIEIAGKLQQIMRRNDYVGRLGGDEFVVFLQDIPDERIAAKKARQICELTRKAYSVEVQISGSVGVSLFPRDGEDFEALYLKADAALNYVKGSGKNHFTFFREGMTDEIDGTREAYPVPALKKLDIKRRMLIVDDSATDCEILKNIFKDDFRVDAVSDGPSALTKMHHYGTALSVVLLDLMLPGMDGYAILQKMQQGASTKGIPVVVVSASDDRDTMLRVIGAGASDLVTKPIDPDVLRIRVNSAVSKVENERLRAQNSLLTMLNDEIESYQSVLKQLGMAVIVSYWINGSYLYSPSVSQLIAGKYDSRPFWRILLSDMVADTATVKEMQQLVYDIANDRERAAGRTRVTLIAAGGGKKQFDMRVYKQVNEFGLTEKMIIALKLSEQQSPYN